jgi:ubiquinone/menaquinone biosynthesis C-methylase UbiE
MDQTQEYFDGVADKWDEMRRAFFGEGVRRQAVDAAGIGPGQIVADVGTGTGFMARAAIDAGARAFRRTGIRGTSGKHRRASAR